MTGIASILGLITNWNPLAVSWCVVPVVVDAFNRVTGRSRPHVCKKTFERVPSLADTNATTPIVFEKSVIRVVASITDMQPGHILAWSQRSSRHTMSTTGVKASTRFSIAAAKRATPHRRIIAAIASAQPLAVFTFSSFQNDKSTEALTCDIQISGHDNLHTRLLCQAAAGASTPVAAHL